MLSLLRLQRRAASISMLRRRHIWYHCSPPLHQQVQTSIELKQVIGGATPTVTVCGPAALNCPVLAVTRMDAASRLDRVICAMPDCPAAAGPYPVLVHIAPNGYASASRPDGTGGAFTVAGEPSLSAVLRKEDANATDIAKVAEGSAAGGVRSRSWRWL